MTIETKFDMGQKVWFMYEDKPAESIINGIHLFSIGLQYAIKTPRYKLSNDYFYENELFATKQELLDSL